MKRESFRSRLGFLLVSAGCAIGIGNVWRFPYVTGKNGGGYFVLFYLLCLLIMGVPVLTMELAVGRASRKSAVLGLQDARKARPEVAHPRLVLPDRLLPADDVLHHRLRLDGRATFGKFLTGAFHAGMGTEDASAACSAQMLSDPGEMGTLGRVVSSSSGFLVCSLRPAKGP